MLLAWLILFFCLIVTDLVDFYEDSETYRRVYSDLVLYQATGWAYVVLHGIGIVAQARGFRAQRTSIAALVGPLSVVAFQTADAIFNLNPICCT